MIRISPTNWYFTILLYQNDGILLFCFTKLVNGQLFIPIERGYSTIDSKEFENIGNPGIGFGSLNDGVNHNNFGPPPGGNSGGYPGGGSNLVVVVVVVVIYRQKHIHHHLR